MNDLKAPWLGSWSAPGSLGRGRRWGDPAWALAAIAQAWMLGGRHGHWPEVHGEARWPEGPQVRQWRHVGATAPERWWISLLRHGSAAAPADLRGPKETDLACHCWQALLSGDAGPWMALGLVLFDRPTRTRWIPVLGAVDTSGCLHLPPFLEPLVPPWMHQLPEGWWAFLLSRTDASGALLPEGPPPSDLPWDLLKPDHQGLLGPLVIRHPPGNAAAALGSRWLVRLDERAWMLDPALRAWGRGAGLATSALASLQSPSLDLGDPLPEAVRLGGEPPDLSGATVAGAGTANPFRWREEGRRALQAHDLAGALRAFAWSHAHFTRLKSPAWVRRTAFEAARTALALGDLPAAASWRRIRGPLEPPDSDREEAELAAARGEPGLAATHARRLTEACPQDEEAWLLQARLSILAGQPEGVREALPHVRDRRWRHGLERILAPGAGPRPREGDPVLRLLEVFQHLREGLAEIEDFWPIWEACPDQPLRLETGLAALERVAGARSPVRLLALRELVDRSASPICRARLDDLWPAIGPDTEPPPEELVRDWLDRRTSPTWICCGPPGRASTLGTGALPPGGLLDALREKGTLGPLTTGGITWWGTPLFWEGSPVGSVLTAVPPEAALGSRMDLHLIAPWLARMAPAAASEEPPPEGGLLLTDGSEPMASVLAELARVATSALPVLVLGPTGSGKELVAREIHTRSGRKGAFIPINCSEYAETLMESELFGHSKGAFTGADRDRKGAIEMAEGGTLFLDEVADLPPRLQSLFLRVLQEREVRRVGGEKIHKVNVRFLAATHRPLDQLVASGHFRKDLHYRLKGVVLTLPSLHERAHEFPYLIPRLAARVALEAGLSLPELAPGLAQALARHPWPGNVRELRHALERALLRCPEGPLKAVHFPELAATPARERGWEEATGRFQRQFLLETLQRHRFQITDASQALGITRPALYAALKRLGIDLASERRRMETGTAPGAHP